MTSPSPRRRSPTVAPFTRVPFVEPEVDDDVAIAGGTDLGVLAAHVRVGHGDVAARQPSDGEGLLPQDDAVAGREHDAAGAGDRGRLDHLPLDLEPARLQVLPLDEVDADRPHERVALVAGVLAGGVAQLVHQRFVDLAEVLEVGLAEAHREEVGDDDAALHVDRAMVVDLAHELATDLDRTQRRAEGPGEHAVDHTLQASLESVDPHPGRGYRSPNRAPRQASRQTTGTVRAPVRPLRCQFREPAEHLHRPRPYGATEVPVGSVPPAHSGEWRNGRRAGFRCQCPQGRGGSSPPSPTSSGSDRTRFRDDSIPEFLHPGPIAVRGQRGLPLATQRPQRSDHRAMRVLVVCVDFEPTKSQRQRSVS